MPDTLEQRLSDRELLEKMRQEAPEIVALKQYMSETPNPVTVVAVRKERSVKATLDALTPLARYVAIVVVVDAENNDLENPYLLLWRVVNNIDAQRDILLDPFIGVDATNKNSLDGYVREWPGDTHCDPEVLDRLKERGLIDADDEAIRRWGLLPFDLYKEE